jgi:excisionase family DNA binding protein
MPSTDPLTPPPDAPPRLLDVHAVASLLDCSPRHVYRLSDGGHMPRPLRLGSLVRWDRSALEQWIADGCPSQRRAER